MVRRIPLRRQGCLQSLEHHQLHQERLRPEGILGEHERERHHQEAGQQERSEHLEHLRNALHRGERVGQSQRKHRLFRPPDGRRYDILGHGRIRISQGHPGRQRVPVICTEQGGVRDFQGRDHQQIRTRGQCVPAEIHRCDEIRRPPSHDREPPGAHGIPQPTHTDQ